MTTPLLHASISHSGDLAVLERLDNVLSGSIHLWWLHQTPSARASFKRWLTAVQATCAALHHHAGDLGFWVLPPLLRPFGGASCHAGLNWEHPSIDVIAQVHLLYPVSF